jgi:cephalosporin-C deacetylase
MHRLHRFLVVAVLGLAVSLEVTAMEKNLTSPWSDGCTQHPYLWFYSPQSDDLLFTAGDTIDLRCKAGLASVALRWTLHRHRIAKPFSSGTAEAFPANRFVISIPTAGLHPGFYDLRVELDTGITNKWRPVRGVCVFGWKAESMAVTDSRPADFKGFWDEAKAKLAKIPLDAKEGPTQTFGPKEINDYNVTNANLPPDYDPTGHRAESVESCKVDFAGPDGGRVYGWLAKPEGKGPFPAMLVLPGGGYIARPRPLEHARHGYVALDIQVHGQDVDLKEYPHPSEKNSSTNFAPVSEYFYNVHLRCLQAVNYLRSRPDVDPSRIVVVGGSHGGRLTVVVAGLDPRISAAVPALTFLANAPYLRWARDCKSDGMELTGAPPALDGPADRCAAYYDPMNFAPDIHCPVLMNAGLIDGLSPPCGVWAVYNRLGSKDKSIVALDGMGHDWSAEFDRRAWKWLGRVLKSK